MLNFLLPFFFVVLLTFDGNRKHDAPTGIAPEARQDLSPFIGAWEGTFEDSVGAYQGVAIVTDGYFSASRYDIANKRFISAIGGSWKLEDGLWVETFEFATRDPNMVGTTGRYKYELKDNELTFTDLGETWTKLDDGTPGELANAWLITGRKRGDEMRTMTPGIRKTMKILSGTRFQWIAYNTETGQFFGTGGGTYTTKNGKYVENIDFFSRDGSRVGASLEFDFEILDGGWHHSGFSSKGDPIYEIWTPRSVLDSE